MCNILSQPRLHLGLFNVQNLLRSLTLQISDRRDNRMFPTWCSIIFFCYNVFFIFLSFLYFLFKTSGHPRSSYESWDLKSCMNASLYRIRLFNINFNCVTPQDTQEYQCTRAIVKTLLLCYTSKTWRWSILTITLY